MKETKLIGVDIGGTKINTCRIENNRIVEQKLVKTPAQESKEFVLETIVASIKNVMTADVKGIGVGVPGMVDPLLGIVKQVQNIPSWKDVQLKQYLENEFQIPVFVNNDANCFAAGEKYFGHAKKINHFIGITLGTGLGGGIIIHDTLYNGMGTGAGEIGFLPYKDGIFEHYCSSQFFSKFYQTTGLEVYNRVLQGDAKAQDIMNEFGFYLGELIKQICSILAPEAIILGGSISKSFSTFEKSMWDNIHTFPFPSVIKNLKVLASDVDDISVLGAAALYYNSL